MKIFIKFGDLVSKIADLAQVIIYVPLAIALFYGVAIVSPSFSGLLCLLLAINSIFRLLFGEDSEDE